MIPYQARYPARAMAPTPGACEQLTRLVYELLDAHDDTARIATGQHLDVRWQVHLSYLRDLQRVARELLARAGQPEGAKLRGAPNKKSGTPNKNAGTVNRSSRRAPISRSVRP